MITYGVGGRDENRKNYFLSTNYYKINLILHNLLCFRVSRGISIFLQRFIKSLFLFFVSNSLFWISLSFESVAHYIIKIFMFLIHIEYQSICFEQLRYRVYVFVWFDRWNFDCACLPDFCVMCDIKSMKIWCCSYLFHDSI